MPLGFERLNARKSQPNAHINFIKPLKTADEKISQDFLERIAAQCLPIMRENRLYVMSLEEYEPNREFVGRNFNAGEVIQLVLKSPQTGRWLPYDYVQMVMMHELAHCKQMNHSKAFWAVRNQYATQMYGLWAKGYTGDGIWGRGANLQTGQWEKNTVRADEVLPEHLCGGTYRSRGRKRKAKPVLTYQQRKERRILKKFGKNGVSLGADEEAKVKLEKGKKVQAKPRVAGSARGRELRAAAALARFDQQKEVKDEVKDEDETESGSDSEYEDAEDGQDMDSKDAVDIDGTRLVDKKGRNMVKVCEDEDAADPGAKNELDELQDMIQGRKRSHIKEESPDVQIVDAPKGDTEGARRSGAKVKAEPGPSQQRSSGLPKDADSQLNESPEKRGETRKLESPDFHQTAAVVIRESPEGKVETATTSTCTMCSFTNVQSAVTCAMCANVLNPQKSRGWWQCKSSGCAGNEYRNSVDCGICGLCGIRRG